MNTTKSPRLKAAAFICAFAAIAIASAPLSAQPLPPAPSLENTVSIDLAPIAFSLVIGQILSVLSDASDDGDDDGDDGVKFGSFSFGIGVQYERRLREKFGLMGRLNYMGIGLDAEYTSADGQTSERVDMAQHTASFETHARYYPFGKRFFLDGMAGLGFMSGGASIESSDKLYPEDDYKVRLTLFWSYATLGPSLGYRGTFGKYSAIGYEISYGYNLIVSMGSPLIKISESDHSGKRVSKYEDGEGWFMFANPFPSRLTVAVSYSF